MKNYMEDYMIEGNNERPKTCRVLYPFLEQYIKEKRQAGVHPELVVPSNDNSQYLEIYVTPDLAPDSRVYRIFDTETKTSIYCFISEKYATQDKDKYNKGAGIYRCERDVFQDGMGVSDESSLPGFLKEKLSDGYPYFVKNFFGRGFFADKSGDKSGDIITFRELTKLVEKHGLYNREVVWSHSSLEKVLTLTDKLLNLFSDSLFSQESEKSDKESDKQLNKEDIKEKLIQVISQKIRDGYSLRINDSDYTLTKDDSMGAKKVIQWRGFTQDGTLDFVPNDILVNGRSINLLELLNSNFVTNNIINDELTKDELREEALRRIEKCFRTGSDTLDLSELNLKTLPPEVFKLTHLKELNIGLNQLESLPPEIGYLTQLESLNIEDNKIKTLPPEIGNLKGLEFLYLGGNQLEILPIEIGNLTDLRQLSLDNNQFKVFPSVITNLKKLEHLYIGYNEIQILPPEIWDLTQLRLLGLSNNQLQDLPSEIGNLRKLTHLYLDNNQLEILPPEIGNLTQLGQLNITNNQLKNLPPEIGNLRKLTHLYLGNNQLQILPPEIGDLTQLRGLFLKENQLQSLPPEIGNLTQLGQLNITNNQLKNLPSEIGNLKELIHLHLSKNQLQMLPPEIGNLAELKYLYLDYNQLENLPSEIGNLKELIHLNLDNNELQMLPREISNLTQLRELELSHNPLEDLPQGIKELSHLRILRRVDNNRDLTDLTTLSGIRNLNNNDFEKLISWVEKINNINLERSLPDSSKYYEPKSINFSLQQANDTYRIYFEHSINKTQIALNVVLNANDKIRSTSVKILASKAFSTNPHWVCLNNFCKENQSSLEEEGFQTEKIKFYVHEAYLTDCEQCHNLPTKESPEESLDSVANLLGINPNIDFNFDKPSSLYQREEQDPQQNKNQEEV